MFNENVVAQLEMNGRTETARFLQLVSWMIKILNIRTPDMERRLRDPDRTKFESVDDTPFSFLQQMVDMFKAMDNKHSRFPGHVMNLTDQMSNALGCIYNWSSGID